MAEVVASSLVRLVCNKMGTNLIKEYGLLSGANKELKKLEGTLKMIRDVLDDAEARQEKEKALRGWLKKLKDVAFEIDDLVDDAALEAVKSENKKIPGIKGKVRNISSIPHSIKFKSKIAHKAKGIREKLDEIAAERSKFHLQENVTIEGNYRENKIARESSSLVIESEVYGREKDKEEIIDFLINTGSTNSLEVMAIVGMGGLGKTTIAQLVYNDERVQNHFENLIWVSVNKNFDIRRITKYILESVTESSADLNLELLQRKLKNRLGGKRFLLVLDDVWNENSEKWDQLRALLTIGALGSKVIVTTRSTRVASIMGAVTPYILTGLSKEDCWLLFEKRAFTSGTNEASSNLVTIGKQIVRKCGGVPLAAKVLGSLMRFKRRESEWLTIRDNDIWNIPDAENEILPSLMLSYICLPSYLKPCFTYCALFPKNETICISVLSELWMAEGFIQHTGSRAELKDVCMEYVEELLSRSLFQDDSSYDGQTVCRIKMHDLVHDLAYYVAGEECSIVKTDGTTNITENTRYSSFVCKNGPVLDSLKSSEIPSNLRTLYLVPSVDNRSKEHEHEHQKYFLNSICSKFILLRALYLGCYPVRELPTSLRKLAHLRYLDLSRTSLEALPLEIGHLQNLRTLCLGRCSLLKKLPDSIGELCNLIVLELCGCTGLSSLPDSIGKLTSLQELDLTYCRIESLPESIVKLINLKSLRLINCFFLRELPSKIGEMRSLVHLDFNAYLECMPCGIGDLRHLRSLTIFVPGGKTKCSISELGNLDLKGKLKIRSLENVQTQQEAKEAKLILKNDLRELELSWNLRACTNHEENSSDTEEEEEKSMNKYFEILAKQEYKINIAQVEQILENLQPPNMLSILIIEGYLGKALPNWLTDLHLPNLVHLNLDSCFKCEMLPEFKKFRSLKTLELSKLTEVRSLNSIGQIPSLEVLKPSCLPLVKCLGWEFYGGDVAFTQLLELELACMPELEEWSEVAAGVEFLPCLYGLTIEE